MANQIKCPNCGEEFEISEALSHSVKEELTKDLEAKIKKEAEAKFKSESDEKIKIIEEELKFKNEKLEESREKELKLHQEKLLLEDEKKTFELEKQRQLDQEREKIRQETLNQFSEAHRLKDMENAKKESDMRKQIEELQMKLNQGSQQLQGEVQELDIQSALTSTFPYDEISEVVKGERGADIKQIVKTNRGNICGTILWESKRTQKWSDGWVAKLKEDLRSSKSDIPVIITPNVPKNIDSFGYFDGIWICKPQYFLQMAEIMRTWLTDIAKQKFISENRLEKSEMLYNYISSREFVQQVESIMEVYREMNEQIQTERRAFEKIWKARESQIMRLQMGVSGITGSVSGIVPLPPIKGLDLLEG